MQDINFHNQAQTVNQTIIVIKIKVEVVNPAPSASTTERHQPPPVIQQPPKKKFAWLEKGWHYFKLFIEIAVVWIHAHPIITALLLGLLALR